MERSFADATNNHRFKRARWRRLWRQQIQDYWIAVIRNVRILLAHQNPKGGAAAALSALETTTFRVLQSLHRCIEMLTHLGERYPLHKPQLDLTTSYAR